MLPSHSRQFVDDGWERGLAGPKLKGPLYALGYPFGGNGAAGMGYPLGGNGATLHGGGGPYNGICGG